MPTVRTKKHPDSAGETEGAPFLVPYKRICQLEAAEVDASRMRTALEAIVSTVCNPDCGCCGMNAWTARTALTKGDPRG
jgi:hypothetical protein